MCIIYIYYFNPFSRFSSQPSFLDDLVNIHWSEGWDSVTPYSANQGSNQPIFSKNAGLNKFSARVDVHWTYWVHVWTFLKQQKETNQKLKQLHRLFQENRQKTDQKSDRLHAFVQEQHQKTDQKLDQLHSLLHQDRQKLDLILSKIQEIEGVVFRVKEIDISIAELLLQVSESTISLASAN